jgi:hypothetical protein
MTGGTAMAQDTSVTGHDTDQPESTMNYDAAKVDKLKSESRQWSGTFGVDELNDIEDWEVVNNGEELGSIDRLGVDRTTGEIVAIVGLEGVLGANMKEVAIPLKSLSKAGDESLSANITKEQLQEKRDIDPWDDTYSQVDDEEASY